MLENRRHFRLREFIDVTWKVTDPQIVSGEGLVVNISSSGLLLQTDRMFRPSDNCILSIEPSPDAVPFAPKQGKIVWFRRIHAPYDRLQCGIQFLEDKEDSQFQQWFDQKVNKLSEAADANILGNLAY